MKPIYDPVTGKVNTSTWFDGKGYLILWLNGKNIRVSRYAYYFMTGNWPKHQMDHIDRDKQNNKWNNLRETTNSQNARNRAKKITNKCGYRGVHKQQRKFAYLLQIDGVKYTKWGFNCPTLAAIARDKKVLELGDVYSNLHLLTRDAENENTARKDVEEAHG